MASEDADNAVAITMTERVFQRRPHDKVIVGFLSLQLMESLGSPMLKFFIIIPVSQSFPFILPEARFWGWIKIPGPSLHLDQFLECLWLTSRYWGFV